MSFDAAFNRIARKREADEKAAREQKVVDMVKLPPAPKQYSASESLRRLFVKTTFDYRPPESGVGRGNGRRGGQQRYGQGLEELVKRTERKRGK